MDKASVVRAFFDVDEKRDARTLIILVLRNSGSPRSWHCGYVGVLPPHGWHGVPYNGRGTTPYTITRSAAGFLEALSFSGDFADIAGIEKEDLHPHVAPRDILEQFVEKGWFFGFAGFAFESMFSDQLRSDRRVSLQGASALADILKHHAEDVTFLSKTL